MSTSNLNPQIRTTEIGIKSLRTITIYPLSLADQFNVSDIIAEGMLAYQQATEIPPPELSEELNDVVPPITSIPISENDPVPPAVDEGTGIEEFDEVKLILDLIESNLLKIVNMVVDKSESIDFNDLTNLQFAEIAEIIYDVNYDDSVGKFQTLINRVKNIFQQKKSSPKLSPVQPTGMNTSSDSPTKTEE